MHTIAYIYKAKPLQLPYLPTSWQAIAWLRLVFACRCMLFAGNCLHIVACKHANASKLAWECMQQHASALYASKLAGTCKQVACSCMQLHVDACMQAYASKLAEGNCMHLQGILMPASWQCLANTCNSLAVTQKSYTIRINCKGFGANKFAAFALILIVEGFVLLLMLRQASLPKGCKHMQRPFSCKQACKGLCICLHLICFAKLKL